MRNARMRDESMDQTTVTILSVTAAINLTALTVFCWIKARKHRAYFWLGSLLGASTLAIIDNLLIYRGHDVQWLYVLTVLANLSWGAYLIGFVRAITGLNDKGKTVRTWYFIPSFLFIGYLLICLFHPLWSENTFNLVRVGKMSLLVTLFNYFICLYAIGSNAVLLLLAHRTTWKKAVGLACCKEVRQLLWPMFILQLGAFVPFLANWDITYIITYMPVFGQLYFLYLFFRLSNPHLTLLFSHRTSDSKGNPKDTTQGLPQPKYANLRLREDKIEEVATAIEQLMLTEQPYLRLNYTLHDLSERLHIPTNVLSMVINSHWKIRFNDYINHHRVAYAKKALCSQDVQRKTIEAIAYDSGFSNRTSIYQAFKKETGMLPNDLAKKTTTSQSAAAEVRPRSD